MNLTDKFGFTALSYSVIASLKGAECKTVGRLLEFGANPLEGNALSIAVKGNMQNIVEMMLFQCCSHPKKATKSKGAIKKGDVVWTRYSELSTMWSLAKGK